MAKVFEIDHLRTWIGNQDIGTDTLTPELLKRFRATLGSYTELGPEVPLGIHWCLAQPAVNNKDLGVDGHPAKGAFLPPVPLPRRMWASSRVKFHKPLRVGVPIGKTSTIADVISKQSAASGTLVFVHIDHTFTQDNETLIEEKQVIVYRHSSALKQAQPTPGSLAQTSNRLPQSAGRTLNILPNSTLLFRYSGMTFNGHRIHYDHNYATTQEGYPGLVVQGPLMATLLMNLARASRPQNVLQAFEFRGVAPTFADEPLQVTVLDDGAESLEIRNHDSDLVMSASAEFESTELTS